MKLNADENYREKIFISGVSFWIKPKYVDVCYKHFLEVIDYWSKLQ